MKIVPFYKIVGLALYVNNKGKLSDEYIQELEDYIRTTKKDWTLTFTSGVKNMLVELYPDAVKKTDDGIKEIDLYAVFKHFYMTKDMEVFELLCEFEKR